jgi:hypothetical protein
MSGEINLSVLLENLRPQLLDDEIVFCTFPNSSYGQHRDLNPIVSVQEPEGLTLLISKATADNHQLTYNSIFRRISLKVHSSLDAVGLTAVCATALAKHGVSANVVAGYFHDHIFVQSELADVAMSVLESLAMQHSR